MKYKLFWIGTIGWAIWMVWLILCLFTTAVPLNSANFFDVLHQIDVTGTYSYEPSWLRILFEPFVGLRNSFILKTEGILLLFGLYFVFRIGIIILEKKVYMMDIQHTKGFQLLDRTITLFSTVFFILAITLVILLLIVWGITTSFLVIGLGGLNSLYYLFVIVSVWFGICGIGCLWAYWHPDNKITQYHLNLQAKYYSWRSKRKLYHFFVQHRGIKRLAKESRRLIVYTLFIGYFMIASLYAWYPTQKINTTLDPNEFLFDFHGHTIRSDGYFTTAEKVEWYRSQGIAGAAFSDHHGIYGSLAAEQYVIDNNLNFTVIIAQEYTSDEPDIHLNIYGLRESINPSKFFAGVNMESSFFPGQYLNVSDMIHYVKTRGGYVTVNHYGMNEVYSLEQLRDWGVDGFEIANGGDQRDAGIRTFCLANNLICIGGSDIADHQDLDTFVRLRLDDPMNRSVDAVFAALRKNQHSVVIVEFNHGDLSPIAAAVPNLQKYFATLNSAQRVSWLIWAMVGYCVGTLMYFIIRKRILTASITA